MASADSLGEPTSLSVMDLADNSALEPANSEAQFTAIGLMDVQEAPEAAPSTHPASENAAASAVPITMEDLREAIAVVRQMDPIGVAARNLRECLLLQLEYLAETPTKRNGNGNGTATLQEEAQGSSDAIRIVDAHLHQVQNKQFKEIARA